MNAFLAQHAGALRDAIRRLIASPLTTLLSLTVIGTALALPTAGWVILDNLRGLTGSASGAQQISVFMAMDAGKKDLAEIESRLRQAKPGEWRFVSREIALKRLQSTEGMAEIVATLPKNPLPDAYIIEPSDTHPESLEQLAQSLGSWPKVAHVQLDSAWVKRFDTFLRVGKQSITLLAALFGGALVAVTFNTIRLQILAQATEIEVAKLIGATDAFIRRPYHYFGLLQGILGALFAALLVRLGGMLLADPLGELIGLYGGRFTVQGLAPEAMAALAVLGGALGWLGAQLSVSIYLRRLG